VASVERIYTLSIRPCQDIDLSRQGILRAKGMGEMSPLPLHYPSSGDLDSSNSASGERDSRGLLTKRNRGRPKGSRNKRSLMVEQMMDGDLEQIVATCLRLAKAGDMAAIREILARTAPVRKGAPVVIDMPAICGVADVPAAMARLTEHVAAGSLSPEEAAAVAAILERYVGAVEACDLAARIDALESRHNEAEQNQGSRTVK